MFIKDMFVKNIDRNIQSVVKVSDREENKIIEIDEYVVTEEIFHCIKKFVNSYKNTILTKNDEIGFWISGFFGSGKSHFLKILYYILNNVGMDILIKNNKCLLEIEEEIKFLSNITKDVILFNIDSKNRKHDSILDIFVNEFNSMRGFSNTHGFICEFEEQLVKENIFDRFKAEFLKLSDNSWENAREEFYFHKESLFKALSLVKDLNYELSEDYFLNIEKNYKMNIEKFSEKVKAYILEKGENHNVVFMIDEVSQFISDDVNKMLNLQTIVEELSNKCFGNAFVIVTSHIDIMAMTKDKKYDFSKIQGRFASKFYLSSINMDEVLYKRLLLKNEVYESRLSDIYDDKKYFLKNILKFDFISDLDIVKMTKKEFVSAYPFFPYQLRLLRDVVYFMIKNNVISDEISKGERSIINFFQRVLVDFKNYDINKVVPFYMFYEPISDFIDYNHKYIFSILKDYIVLNSFDINILKILFLIKYVPNIVPTVYTITSLIRFDIDDKNDIKNQVVDSLRKLISEGFVNNDGDKFYFLSKIERDINYKIIRTNINSHEIKEFLCDEIFNKICKISKIKYQNKINFSINQILDELNYKTSSKNLIGVKFLTTNYDENFNIDSMRILSSIENNVIVYLDNDKNLIEEINIYLKLEKFLKYNKTNLKDSFREILIEKEIEVKNRLERIEVLIEDSIKNSYVFVNGESISTNFLDANDILKNAVSQLIFCRFNKFSYINKFVENSKKIIEIFQNEDALNEVLRLNSLFLNELFDFISEFEKVNLIDVVNYFKNIPYGFNRYDVLFGILYFLKIGKILCNYNFREIIESISDKNFINKIEISKSCDISEKEFNFCKKILGEIFNKKYLFNNFQDFFEQCKVDLENLNLKICKIKNLVDENYLYPGKTLVYDLENIINNLINSTSNEFIKTLNYNKDIVENFEKFEIVYNFYNSIQFEIFNQGIRVFEVFMKDKNFIDDENFKNNALMIEKILKSENPYSSISKLKIYINDFWEIHREILNNNFKIIDDFIENEILNFLDLEVINELKNKLKNCSSLFDVYGVKMESIFIKEKNLKLKG